MPRTFVPFLLLLILILGSCNTIRAQDFSGEADPTMEEPPLPNSAADELSLNDPPASTPPPATLSTNRFGVSLTANELDPRTPTALRLAREAGVGSLRMMIYWSRVEPQRDQFTWAGYDALVADAGNAGFEILGTLGYGVSWNSTAPLEETRALRRERYPPADLSAWDRYLFETVSRYRGSIHTWEIWNEPDLKEFWTGTPAEYARLLAVGYQAVKRADPTARVAIAGLALGGSAENRATNFFRSALEDAGSPALRFFDVANFHQYGPLGAAQPRLEYVRTELGRAGVPELPVWVTELGYSSQPDLQRVVGYQNGEDSQSQWLVETLSMLVDSGVDRVFWFTLYDHRNAGTTYASHGLLDGNLRPKQAYFTYKNLIQTYSPPPG